MPNALRTKNGAIVIEFAGVDEKGNQKFSIQSCLPPSLAMDILNKFALQAAGQAAILGYRAAHESKIINPNNGQKAILASPNA